MQAAHRCHDRCDKVWELLEPHLPCREGTRGVTARDNRNFTNAVFRILWTGAPWRDLPPYLGDRKNTHRHFCRWRDRDNGVWERLLEILISKTRFWMAYDRRKPYQGSTARCWSIWWQSGEGTHKRGLNSKIHLVVDAHGILVRMFIIAGSVADCSQASRLIEGIDAESYRQIRCISFHWI